MKYSTAGLWALAVMLAGGLARPVLAHCDTMNGPVIPEARAALEKGDVTPLLKWVKAEDEAEIKTAFDKTVVVRKQGPEAKELADRYFLETLIRVHRAGEGFPFTGLKDEPVLPILALADKALEEGSPDAMIAKMQAHLGTVVREKYEAARKARADKDKSVEAGRVYVEAYVAYTHYIEGVRNAVMATGAHHGGGESKTEPHAAPHQD